MQLWSGKDTLKFSVPISKDDLIAVASANDMIAIKEDGVYLQT